MLSKPTSLQEVKMERIRSLESLNSISMEISRGEVGFEYWWRWQVLICALIIIIPAVICLVLIRRKLKQGNQLSHGCLWVPCWRGLNPKWLLLYRILAFLSMAWILYRTIAFAGIFVFYFYTQWTFTLVMVYFAIGVIISAQGCWLYTEAGSSFRGKEKIRSNMQKQLDLESANDHLGFWGYVMHTIYQVSAGASILTDTVFWCILVPMLSGKEFQLTLVLGLIHSVNVVFLIIDSSLNNLPFKWFGFTYFAWWSVLYITFQWALHAYGFTRWPYPFLEVATPWAPVWYLGLALFHIPCYGLYIILMKAMTSAFSGLFPRSYMRLNEGTQQHEKAT